MTKTEVITLPNNRVIKFRVKDEGDDWTLLEVIVDDATLEFLNAMAVDAEVDKPKEAPQATPQVTETAIKEKDKEETALSEEQIEAIKSIKNSMHIENNEDLNRYVQDWSMGQGMDYHYINGSNVDDFIQFMKNEYLGQ